MTPHAQAKFPLFGKIRVNGKDAHPLYAYLKVPLGGTPHTEGYRQPSHALSRPLTPSHALS